MRRLGPILGVAVLAGSFTPTLAAQELPLAPVRGTDQGVWPAFEGWYETPQGTRILYFGYHNRNAEQVVEVPLGEDNFIEPSEFDGHQPTVFQAHRHWGVFGIEVPGDFDPETRVYWNLVIDGHPYRVPGHVLTDWRTDALGGGATGNTPPVLTLGTASGSGPLGVWDSSTRQARVNQPLELTVAMQDDGAPGADLVSSFFRQQNPQVALVWFKHQGPGSVEIGNSSGRIPASGGDMTVSAVFSEPGDYVLRVRATDSSVEASGHAQCCWTNGYVNVTVTP